jgi:hypothetical protein
MSENDKFGKGKFGGKLIFKTEVVNGTCPTCSTDTVFVSLYENFYRCTACGHDLEQKINGLIQYIPISSHGGTIPIIKYVEDGPPKA